MADQWLKRMSTVPCLMWRPHSATLVTCCALVGAVTVPLVPDAVWPGESWGNPCLSSAPGTSHLRCTATCTRPWPCLNIKTVFPGMGIPMLKIRRSWDRLIFKMGIPILVRRRLYIETGPCDHSAVVHGNEAWGPNTSDLQWVRRDDRSMIHWICDTKDQDETPSDYLLQKPGIEDISTVLRSQWLRWCGHVQRVMSSPVPNLSQTSRLPDFQTAIPGTLADKEVLERRGMNAWRIGWPVNRLKV